MESTMVVQYLLQGDQIWRFFTIWALFRPWRKSFSVKFGQFLEVSSFVAVIVTLFRLQKHFSKVKAVSEN